MRLITIDGQDGVFLSHEEHRDLVDARDHALALGRYRADGIAIPEPEMDAYLAAATPLAFWRKRSGKTQAALATEVGVSQPFMAQLEAGTRDGTVGVLSRIARALGLRIEDLVEG